MASLDGRVAIVTGAGRGIGLEHAKLLAAEGASVVVNDLGAQLSGEGTDESVAEAAAEEIRAAGGRAVASTHDVADWTGARDLIEFAVRSFGDLHVLVTNAGNLRIRMLADLSEEDWDAQMRIHLKGQAAPTRHALEYWRSQAKVRPVRASVICVSSPLGLFGNPTVEPYSVGKLGAIGIARGVSQEGVEFGVRGNTIVPQGRSRMWLDAPPTPPTPSGFQPDDPANVSPLVAWLAQENCPANGQIYFLAGGDLAVLSIPAVHARIDIGERWTIDALDERLSTLLVDPIPSQFAFTAGHNAATIRSSRTPKE